MNRDKAIEVVRNITQSCHGEQFIKALEALGLIKFDNELISEIVYDEYHANVGKIRLIVHEGKGVEFYHYETLIWRSWEPVELQDMMGYKVEVELLNVLGQPARYYGRLNKIKKVT